MTEERLHEIDQHIADGGGDCNGHTERALVDLVAEVRRLREVRDARVAERAVIQAALSAEMTLVSMALAEALHGGQLADQVLALVDATAVLRQLEVQP
jgi:hypothetical protein